MAASISKYEEIYENSYPYNVITSGIAIFAAGVAIIANISLLISVVKYKTEKWKIDMKLCFILLCVDLVMASNILVNASVNIARFPYYIGNETLCKLNGILITITVSTEVNLMGVISLERFLLVLFNIKYGLKFYLPIIALFCILNIANEIQVAINNAYEIYPIALYCMYNQNKTSGLVGSVLIIISGGLSYSLIVVCYLSICLYRRSQSQKAQIELGLDPAKVRKEVNATIYRSLSIIFFSILTTGVYVTIIIISWFNPSVVTPVTDMIQSILVECQMIINTFVLLNMRPELWKQLKNLYGFS
ncbi:hypothetical protein CONCODRAFT_14226 [Conidiobolus coronatus NRRL 28638]|uniref:G-protein coupled receptors family 1 profile domain-containing protein n=1 Tax=Conidiobolus coronatus (strain ATCC 28846 / CBS 209.66 / NRRL 28638) TaxID=796925 RepID=A0A137NPE5_CONC2|nr:hypothetical protein CONCODRAFT_14226 [Conidiobolus coronatus NRRL 28638]|eukprot:KXN64606.1 hypothetical protein CONCODRAFT_14226 [Conidiobolus coronatus NRRL 28638]